MIDLTGKTAIVGGSASGIGEVAVRLLASLGAKVVVADIAFAAAETVAGAINAEGGTAIALRYDLHDETSIRTMIEDAVSHYGRLDILHANAADLRSEIILNDEQIVEAEAGIWDQMFHANCTGTMLCAKYAIPHMISGGGGSIVLTGSNMSQFGSLGNSAYAASKAAIVQLARQIATQYGKKGVRANAVLPATTLTDTVRARVPQRVVDITLEETLTPQLCEPIDTAYAVAFLASDAARMITAQALLVDGGRAAHWPGIGRLREIGA